MADQMDFELKLGAAVKVFAANVDRPVDASRIAATALGATNEGWLSRQLRRPALARRSLANAAIAVAFVVLAGFGVALYANRVGLIGPGPSPTPSITATPKPATPLPTEAAPSAVLVPTSGGMWPQSTGAELEAAQDGADAGDPDYTWQIDPELVSPPDGELGDYLLEHGTQIVERFVHDELGWDHALLNAELGLQDDGPADGYLRGLVYHRCAAGETNSLYPIPEGFVARGADKCSPTIDELRYETVSIDLSQPVERGANGIWVVNQWRMVEPFAQADSVAAKATAERLLKEFLQSRVDGEGAERYVTGEVPLLYAASGGSRYQRFEIELVGGPHWPDAHMEYAIRLFAEDGTVVEQSLDTNDTNGGSLGLDGRSTTEDGQPVPVKYVFADGQVSLAAPSPWAIDGDLVHWYRLSRGDDHEERIEPMGNPLPVGEGCEPGAQPGDAEVLAQAIASNPGFVTTAPVAVTLNGVPALSMDVTVAPDASVCEESFVLTRELSGSQRGLPLDEGSRMRLYLLDAPAGSSLGILVIAIVAPESRFEDTLDAAAPILETLEFHVP